MQPIKSVILDEISNYCRNLEKEFSLIPHQRKSYLFALADYFSSKFQQKIRPKIIVICTHNSRRSHLGQLWLAVSADYYQLPKIETYSGGTEATAFNPRAVVAIQKVGFQVEQTRFESATNPIYDICWTTDNVHYAAFSKKFDAPPNPTKHFGAVMVCSEADEACPFVPGADFRLSLPFEDPKAFDDTPMESEKYAERCRQIGRELLFAMSQVKGST